MAYSYKAVISLKKGGGVPFPFPHIPTGRSQNVKILILSGVTAILDIGPINMYLEVLILDTGFKYLMALSFK